VGGTLVEPISKLPKKNKDASKLNKSEEVLRFEFITNHKMAESIEPSKKALNLPTPFVTT